MNATLETPLTRLPSAGLVWLDGSPRTTTERAPAGVTFEIRPPSTGLFVLPVYGAAPPDACRHLPTVECDPPSPPSATYRSPFGPKTSPRGLLKPVAKTLTCAACVAGPADWPIADAAWPPATSPTATARLAAAMVVRFMDDPSWVVEMVGLDPRNVRAAAHRKICPVSGVVWGRVVGLHHPATRPAGAAGRRRGRPPAGHVRPGAHARVVGAPGRPGRAGLRARLDLPLPDDRHTGPAAGRRLGRVPGRARVHAGVVRLPRSRRRARSPRCAGGRAVGADARRPGRLRRAQPDAVPGDRGSRAAAARRALAADVRAAWRHLPAPAHAGGRARRDREGVLPGVPTRPACGRGARLARSARPAGDG